MFRDLGFNNVTEEKLQKQLIYKEIEIMRKLYSGGNQSVVQSVVNTERNLIFGFYKKPIYVKR